MKIKENYSFYSNIIFLLPLFFSIKKGDIEFSLVIFSLFVASLLFHYFKPRGAVWFERASKLKIYKKEFFWIDVLAANVLVLYNLFAFTEKGFPNEFWYSIVIFGVALYFYLFMTKRKQYDLCHGLWHIFVGIITLLAVIA